MTWTAEVSEPANETLTSGKHRGGVRFGVGYLAMLLRNRFYVGEVVHRGQIYPGEQLPILDRKSFNAVQDKLAAGANARQLTLHASPSILAGRIFDEHGNRMTPVHTNKQGARYRYYVAHTALQERGSRKSKTRINAADIEAAILAALCKHLAAHRQETSPVTDHELIAMHVERIVVKSQEVEISLGDGHLLSIQRLQDQATATKGIVHAPDFQKPMPDHSRDLLLKTIAKARCWNDDIVEGRVASFADIAENEDKVERHIRLLAPLAFVSPRVISNIADGTLPGATVTGLAKSVSYSWFRQKTQSEVMLPAAKPTRKTLARHSDVTKTWTSVHRDRPD